MYRRIIILSVIILVALAGLSALGYRAIRMHSQGLEGRRIGEFASVAQQIRLDVMQKLNEFIRAEKKRPHMEYQYQYIPRENQIAAGQRELPMLKSPLGESIENQFAYGYFQIDSSENITTPYYSPAKEDMSQQVQRDMLQRSSSESDVVILARRQGGNVKKNLMPILRQNEVINYSIVSNVDKLGGGLAGSYGRSRTSGLRSKSAINKPISSPQKATQSKKSKLSSRRQRSYEIEIQESNEKTQVYQQQRQVAVQNQALNSLKTESQIEEKLDAPATKPNQPMMGIGGIPVQTMETAGGSMKPIGSPKGAVDGSVLNDSIQGSSDMVQVRVEPFVTMVGKKVPGGIFDGQVFLVRHVQVAEEHFLQGFQLNERRLVEQINASAARFVREGMDYTLVAGNGDGLPENAAYTAVLNFEFGNVVLHLLEKDPAWIAKQSSQLQYWYFSIITIVVAAVGLGLVSLWRNMRQQILLARKKDDFISAVSHELRTPLTSMRIYSEMLENNWLKSDDKRQEYYRNMRQESERLTRLIENVLDFSRIQRKKKRYNFQVGDLNECIKATVEKMRPYARQAGFEIAAQLDGKVETAYDRDAVMQIVINLIDNAVKYARQAQDKTINVKTISADGHVIIEVQDHGPGIPHRQRQKIFDEFYRCQDESVRETTGTGLGLALVKRFAEAHNGFVEILSPKPGGAIFRVTLACNI